MLPVCKVPRTLPATFSGVCVAISACDMGMKPVKIPINKRKIKSCQTDVANPIKKIEIPRPVAKKINNFFLPYLSPIRPQMGANKKAATKVIPNVQPAQFCTYTSEKFPNVSINKEINGKIIVILLAIKDRKSDV